MQRSRSSTTQRPVSLPTVPSNSSHSSRGLSTTVDTKEVYKSDDSERSCCIEIIHNSPRSRSNDDRWHPSNTIEVTLTRKGRLRYHHQTRVLRVPEIWFGEKSFTNKDLMHKWEYSMVNKVDLDPTGATRSNDSNALMRRKQDPGDFIHLYQNNLEYLMIVVDTATNKWQVRPVPATERAARYQAWSEEQERTAEAERIEKSAQRKAARQKRESATASRGTRGSRGSVAEFSAQKDPAQA